MKMQTKSIWMATAFVVAATFSLSAAHAQSQAAGSGYGGTPVPAARGVSSAYDAQPYDPAQVEPDTNTLSGAENFGVGSLQKSRNVFDPSIGVSSWGQTGTIGRNGQNYLHPTSLIGGGLNFNRIWGRYQFTTSYRGGVNLYYGYQQNIPYHGLRVSQGITWLHGRLHLPDDF